MQRMSDPPRRKCEACGSQALERLISQTSFQLKGGGWYKDLYASPRSGGASKSDGASDTGSGSVGGSSSSADSGASAGSDKSADKSSSADRSAGSDKPVDKTGKRARKGAR
jgi:predicted nucleic acid-binding Zn ribbon protein